MAVTAQKYRPMENAGRVTCSAFFLHLVSGYISEEHIIRRLHDRKRPVKINKRYINDHPQKFTAGTVCT